MTKLKRSDADYLNESFANGLLVLEALEGMDFEPVNVTRIAQRTGLSYDFCMRALRTLRWKGYAEEIPMQGWRSTGKFEAFLKRAATAQKDAELATVPTQAARDN